MSKPELLRPPVHASEEQDTLPYKLWTAFCGRYRPIGAFRFEVDAIAYRNLITNSGSECWLQTPVDVYHHSARVAS